jgi:hypothetical protein
VYLIALTEDHDYGRQLDREVRAGRLFQAEAEHHPERGALVSFVGQAPMALIDGSGEPLGLRSGDRLLACSDGLYKGLDAGEIGLILDQSLTPQEAADNSVNRVLDKRLHGQDNITVLVLECDAERPTVRRSGAPEDKKRPDRPGRVLGFLRKPKSRDQSAMLKGSSRRVGAWALAWVVLAPAAWAGNALNEAAKRQAHHVLCAIDEDHINAGSGFLIDQGRRLVTNWHVVECLGSAPPAGGRAGIILADQDLIPLRLEWRSARRDLAILTLDTPMNAAVTFAGRQSIEERDKVIVAGFPGRRSKSIIRSASFPSRKASSANSPRLAGFATSRPRRPRTTGIPGAPSMMNAGGWSASWWRWPRRAGRRARPGDRLGDLLRHPGG